MDMMSLGPNFVSIVIYLPDSPIVGEGARLCILFWPAESHDVNKKLM